MHRLLHMVTFLSNVPYSVIQTVCLVHSATTPYTRITFYFCLSSCGCNMLPKTNKLIRIVWRISVIICSSLLLRAAAFCKRNPSIWHETLFIWRVEEVSHDGRSRVHHLPLEREHMCPTTSTYREIIVSQAQSGSNCVCGRKFFAAGHRRFCPFSVIWKRIMNI